MATILIVFHSITGATYKLAAALAEGVQMQGDCVAVLKQIPNITGSEVIFGGQDMTARTAPFQDIPQASVEDLLTHDAVAVGTPVYFGNQSSAVRYFFDQAGSYWMEGSLTGKPATAFAGGGSGAGREAALLSLWSTFAVFGMTILPLGTRAQQVMPVDEITGTTPFGAAVISGGPGSRPSDAELQAARIQGQALAALTERLTV